MKSDRQGVARSESRGEAGAHSGVGRLVRRVKLDRFAGIWVATGLLFAFSPLIAPGSLNGSALLSILPFAAVLAIASAGQTLVVQQGGLDLSVPGVMSLAAVIVTRYPNLDDDKLPVGILLVLAVSIAAGLANGLAVTKLGITPLVATLGMSAIMIGGVLAISHGSPTGATNDLNRFAFGKTGGVPNTVIFAVIVIAVGTLILRKMVVGRRFEIVGANPEAARAAGLRTDSYRLGAYVLAAVLYGIAGILLSGYVKTPGIYVGDSYLLPTVAAVVIGGTALTGGKGSLVATAIGALFLSQLDQLVLTTGASTAIQYMIQGVVIALGVAIRTVPWRRVLAYLRGVAGGIGDGRRGLQEGAPG